MKERTTKQTEALTVYAGTDATIGASASRASSTQRKEDCLSC